MSLDGKILKRAKLRLDREREARQAEQERRLQEVYLRDGHMREIDAELQSLMADAVGIALSSGKNVETAIGEISEQSLLLQEERIRELSELGLPADYLDSPEKCPKCHDTGYEGIKICSCLMELYRDEQRRELSSLLDLGGASFDAFELDYYPNTVDPQLGVSPRAAMEDIYNYCVWYSRSFSAKSANLFFRGGTGLGKTFLSTCIARDISEKGFSVVYDTAQSIFAKLEEEKFSREENAETKADINRIFGCDLLILDDLGTELSTSFVTSALYNLINTRLLSGKKTIISSNLAEEELSARYSPQIASRILGEYEVLKFWGQDIRFLRKQKR